MEASGDAGFRTSEIGNGLRSESETILLFSNEGAAELAPDLHAADGSSNNKHKRRTRTDLPPFQVRSPEITPANGAGFDGFFGWVLIQVLLDEWKQVTL